MSGTFSSNYSDEQRAAVVAAFVDDGTTAPAIVASSVGREARARR